MKKAGGEFHRSKGEVMASFDRRSFLRLSAVSIGTGALLQFFPSTAHAATASKLLGKRTGEAPSPFSIVQLSDTHVGFNGPPDPLGTAAFERAVDMINALSPQPDLILFTGDLTHDSEDSAEHAKRFGKFKEIAGHLRVQKRFFVPGEHDAALDGGTLFREHLGETHRSFDHKGVHFVALDNVSAGRPAVGKAQIAWLKSDLARYSKETPIVVFTHRPLFDLKPEWEWFTSDGDAVMNVLAPFDAVTVLYGHIHREQQTTLGNAQHYAARSLIFAFPDPATTAEKKPLPFDPAQPFRNLGIRRITDSGAHLAIDDIELTKREVSGANGVAQLLRQGELL
ncbi:MAG TPA: metallophosphoesterase [Thermoanaerobaculia bacterium]|jgi:3',5'-cyclic AMP phosphodiesterase CpdA|nr:metallophosphoesterase [Thermoanaerobaculia bacterium]